MCESIVVVGAALSADVDAPTERFHSAPGARRGQSPLHGRIVFTPKGEGYTFEAATRFDKLFSGIVAPRPSFIEGNGPDHIGPEDTLDADYGRLLARATERREKSPIWVHPQGDRTLVRLAPRRSFGRGSCRARGLASEGNAWNFRRTTWTTTRDAG